MHELQNKRASKLIVRIIGAIIIIYFIFKVFSGIIHANKSLGEFTPSTYSLSSDDSNLISTRYLEKIKVLETYTSTVRNPVSFSSFDSRYNLIFYKIDSANDQNLGDFIHLETKDESSTVGITYRVMANKVPFKFLYKSGPVARINQVFLTISGDSLETVIKNDSVLCYHFLCNNFSIRYSKHDPIDIFLKEKNDDFNKSILSMDLLFLKRNKCTYLLFMTPIGIRESISKDFLLQLLR